jgi:S1-C subfamily serine protease
LIAAVGGLAVFAWTAMRQGDSVSGADAIAVPASVPVARVPPQEPAATPELPAPIAPAEPSQPSDLIAASNAPASRAAVDGPVSSLEDVIGRAMPAVVRVETPRGSGSGFFVAGNTILTNVHVVANNAYVTIRKQDGSTMQAHVELTAPEFDVAVLRLPTSDPSQAVLALGSGAHARPGQEIVALGTPLGLQNTVTRGIVSAVRQVGGVTLVQTDAAINPGNSGGPLVDRSGQVIGITTMGIQSSVAQGLGFGVAIEHARSLLAGDRVATGAPTPVAGLNEAMAGRPAASEANAARDRATQIYEKALATVASQADGLDGRWRSFKSACYEGRVAGAFDHEWYALWEPKAMQGAVAPGCGAAFTELRRAAEDIRTNVVAVNEAARQADIYPGTRRELLRRYKLDYAGWDK